MDRATADGPPDNLFVRAVVIPGTLHMMSTVCDHVGLTRFRFTAPAQHLQSVRRAQKDPQDVLQEDERLHHPLSRLFLS